MDPKQAPKQAAAPAPGLVEAVVRPHNKYDGKTAGQRVSVEPGELIRCKHALISVAEWEAEKTRAAAPKPQANNMFRQQRKSAQLAWEQHKRSLATVKRGELEALGLTIAQA